MGLLNPLTVLNKFDKIFRKTDKKLAGVWPQAILWRMQQPVFGDLPERKTCHRAQVMLY